MHRRRSLMAFVLCLSLVATPSFAAVKAGAKCTKAGSTSTAGGKKYTCVKSGTKLVWNKGVAVKTSSKQDLDPVIKQVEPTPTPTPAATPTPTQKPLTPLAKLYADIYQRYVVAQKNISPSFNFVRCPNANKEMAETTEKAYIDAYALRLLWGSLWWGYGSTEYRWAG